jgi:hypothetical protein
VGGSPEEIAAWFGCASAAEIYASEAWYAKEKTREADIDAEVETGLEAEAAP